MDSTRHTCLRLELSGDEDTEAIFIKGTWFSSHFSLCITDGLNAWVCNASENEVEERADQWDQPVPEYIQTAEQYLGFRQPGSDYSFLDAGSGHKRLSWTFEKQGMKLEWRWKCKPSTNNKKTTSDILDFLMDANIRLSEEVVRKTQSFEKLKVEAEKCLAQSEKFSSEKAEFESAIYAKFIAVLNSKKAKLRELRDQKQDDAGKSPEEDVSTDKTETYDEETDNDKSEDTAESLAGTGKSVPARRGGKRKSNK